MKNVFLLITSISLLIFFSCKNERHKDTSLHEELLGGKKNSIDFSESFKNYKKDLNTKSSSQLNDIAVNIYNHIGLPFTKEDTIRLNIAIEYLNRALELESNNRSAYKNKLNICASMEMWGEALNTIDEWMQNGEPYYYDFMLKGFVFESIGINDSVMSNIQKALILFEKESYKMEDVKHRVQKAIMLSFLYGEKEGLKEVDKIIEATKSDYAIVVKESVIKGFNKKSYVEKNVFKKVQQIN